MKIKTDTTTTTTTTTTTPAPAPAPAPALIVESIPGVPISGIRMGSPTTPATLETGAFLKDCRLQCSTLEINGGAVLHRTALEISGPADANTWDGPARLQYARSVGETLTRMRVDLKGSTVLIVGLNIVPRGWVSAINGLKPDPQYVREGLGALPLGNAIKL